VTYVHSLPMGCLARFGLSGAPHYVTQRGDRPQHTFLSDGNFVVNSGLLTKHCVVKDVSVWI